jgi:cytochrome bd ubiquinol oxidase subunit I
MNPAGIALRLAMADEPAGLLPAREQMARSVGWHVVLACFGVTLPSMIFVLHRRGIVARRPRGVGAGACRCPIGSRSLR